jgi:hypothetical protein
MSYTIWKSFYDEFFLQSISSFKRSIGAVVLLFKTIAKTISDPVSLILDRKEKDLYLSAAQSSRVLTKLAFSILTISALYNTSQELNTLPKVMIQYLILFGYLGSIMTILLYSYLVNLRGDNRIERADFTANSLLYMFNVIYLVTIFINLTAAKMSNAVVIITVVGLAFSIYYLIKIGNRLNYSQMRLLLNRIFIILLIAVLTSVNSVLTLLQLTSIDN